MNNNKSFNVPIVKIIRKMCIATGPPTAGQEELAILELVPVFEATLDSLPLHHVTYHASTCTVCETSKNSGLLCYLQLPFSLVFHAITFKHRTITFLIIANEALRLLIWLFSCLVARNGKRHTHAN